MNLIETTICGTTYMPFLFLNMTTRHFYKVLLYHSAWNELRLTHWIKFWFGWFDFLFGSAKKYYWWNFALAKSIISDAVSKLECLNLSLFVEIQSSVLEIAIDHAKPLNNLQANKHRSKQKIARVR